MKGLGGSMTLRVRLPGTPAIQINAPAHPSQCLTPKHPSLLKPRLPHPRRLGGPRVGALATSPLPSEGVPNTGTKKWEKGGGQPGKWGNTLPSAPTHSHWPGGVWVRGGHTPYTTA